jgi:hypothetical protein
MPIDYPYVAKLAYWSTKEGVAFLLGVEPHHVGFRHERNWRVYDEHQKLLTLVHRAIQVGQLQGGRGPDSYSYSVRPNEFIRWADKIGLPVPAGLRAAVDQTQSPQPSQTATIMPPASQVVASELNERKRSRSDLMAIEIERAIQELGGNADQARIMGRLQSYVGRDGSCITEAGAGFVLWHDDKGDRHKLTRDSLRKRLDRLAERTRK